MDTTDTISCNKFIRLDTFDTATAVDPTAEDEAKRRFMTLILQIDHRSAGSNGHVLRATNTSGEVFAVKLLVDNAILAAGDAPARSAEQAALHLAATASLFEEYRYLCTVSHLRGFPRVYGYGSCEDDPLILMEWVEGVSLAKALPLLPHEAAGGVATDIVAAAGSAVLRTLLGTQSLVNPIVHRDLSPANIMFRTVDRTLDEQIAARSFDPCLVDMGSATVSLGNDTLTKRADIWRFATPAYAAPEMLTQDIPGVTALRRSPAVDVYALASILYELYSGSRPFDTKTPSTAALGSFYLIKTQTDPAPLEPRSADDKPLVDIIMQGLSIEQRGRPTQQQMLEALARYVPEVSKSQGVELTSDDLPIDIDAGTHLKIDLAGERASAAIEAEHQKTLTRRRFLLGGAAAIAGIVTVAGIATRGFGIPDYIKGIRDGLNDYSWEQLQEISFKIKAAPNEQAARALAIRYHLLDAQGHIPYPCTKQVTLSNGLAVGAQLVGLRHDSLTDGTGKAGLSFLFDAGIDCRNANSQSTSFGWRACDLRSWLDNEGLDLMPGELKTCIKPVDKVSNNVGAAADASCLSEISSSLWLPSMTELAGKQPPKTFSKEFRWLSPIYSNEGAEYQLFRELETTPYSANSELVRTWKGKDTCWWERTVSPDKTDEEGTLYLNRVGTNGDVYMFSTPAHDPDKKTCVVPGFCI